MHWVWLIVALPPAAAWLVALAHTVLSVRRLPVLTAEPARGDDWPTLSIVTPARDEQDTIEGALRSALASDYPALQVVAVDDRSSDRTGAIIDSLAAADERMAPVHVTALPDGWLGKLNALQRGVERATGEWLLFADADTHYAAGALRQAIAFAERTSADLVTAYPHLTSRAFALGTVFSVAPVLAQLTMPTWRVRDPRSRVFAGMGAFILVRRAALERTPGLAWLRLEIADDMGLGLLIKSHGGRLEVVNGRDAIFLEFYATFGEMLRRMQKNWWAIMARFSVARAASLALVMTWFALAPLVALLPGAPPSARTAAAVGWAAMTAASVIFDRWVRRPLLPGLFPQVGLLLCVAMLVRATFVGVRIGGVEWRGRVYTTAELRPHQRVLL